MNIFNQNWQKCNIHTEKRKRHRVRKRSTVNNRTSNEAGFVLGSYSTLVKMK